MSSANKTLPGASVLFSPEELSWYMTWWKEHHHVDVGYTRVIHLPTAFEYVDYLEWICKRRVPGAQKEQEEASKKQDSPHPTSSPPSTSPSTSATAINAAHAARCEHLLHPGHPANTSTTAEGASSDATRKSTVLWCPKCTLAIHVRMLNELWPRWAALGGPWRQLPNGARGEDYSEAKQAFRIRKLDLVNAMEEIEAIAQLEAEWEAANPDTQISEVVKERGAAKTVYLYHLDDTFPEGLPEANVRAPQTPTSTPHKAKKRLSYSPGTPEDTRHRPNDKYARGYPAYDPQSPHACPNEEGWADTALRQDWRFNVRQCRLLYCDKDPREPNVTYQELSDDKSKDRLIEGIDVWFANMERAWVPQWTAILMDTSDIFLAWKCDTDGENENGDFSNWGRVGTLVGTNLEAHAQAIGDIDEEDFVEHKRALEELEMQDDTTDDDADEASMQVSSDQEDSDDEFF